MATPCKGSKEGTRFETADLAALKVKVMYCAKHAKQKLKFFCETCQELVCNDCTLHLHKDHEYGLVTDTFPKYRDNIQVHLDTVNMVLEALETRKKEIKDCRTDLRRDINELVTQIHKALDERKGELLYQLDQTTEQKLDSLAEQEEGIKTLQTQLSSCVEYVESSLKTGTEGEILAMKATVVKQFQEIVPAINPDRLRPQEFNDVLIVDDDAPGLTTACRKLAAVTTTDPAEYYITGNDLNTATVGEQSEVTLHSKGKRGWKSLIAADVNARLVCGQPATEIQCNVEKVGESECRIRYTPTTRGKQQLHITLGGRHTKGSPHSVVIRPRPQDIQKPIKVLSDMKFPSSITTDSKGRIIVTERKAYCVTVFTPDGDKLRSFGSQGSGIGQFEFPFGVAVDSDDNIYVGDLINHRIQKFSPTGEPLMFVGSHGVNPLEFNGPYHITFNPRDGNLYICDRGNHRIQILDTDLAFCRMISGQQGGTGKFSYPQGVAFDSDGNVYIAARVHIPVFNPEGLHLGEIGSAGDGPGELQDAEGIAIDHDSVYVTDFFSHRVSIFTTSGQFLHSFGSNGSEPGLFNYPRGITIDGNSHILVTDWDNK